MPNNTHIGNFKNAVLALPKSILSELNEVLSERKVRQPVIDKAMEKFKFLLDKEGLFKLVLLTYINLNHNAV